MIRSFLTKFALVGGAFLLITGTVQATPFTFEFNLPTWESTSNSSIWGTHGVLDVTVDNGANNTANQTYINSQITQVTLTTAGGTFSDTWTSGYGWDGASFLSTDAQGVITLDLLASVTTPYYVFSNTAGLLQLGVIGFNGGPTPLYGSDTASSSNAIYSSFNGNGYSGFSTTGQLISNVPEPMTLTLLMIGFAGLVFSRRRNKI